MTPTWDLGAWALVLGIWVVGAIPIGIVIGRYLRTRRLLSEMDELELCAQGCGRPATHERIDDYTADGTPITLLVCRRHADGGLPR